MNDPPQAEVVSTKDSINFNVASNGVLDPCFAINTCREFHTPLSPYYVLFISQGVFAPNIMTDFSYT